MTVVIIGIYLYVSPLFYPAAAPFEGLQMGT